MGYPICDESYDESGLDLSLLWTRVWNRQPQLFYNCPLTSLYLEGPSMHGCA